MTPLDLIERAEACAAKMEPMGDLLRVRCSIGPLPPDVVAALQEGKAGVLSLLRSLPAYTEAESRALVDWCAAQEPDTIHHINRRAAALRAEDGVPMRIAGLLAIESERDDTNPRLKLAALYTPASDTGGPAII